MNVHTGSERGRHAFRGPPRPSSRTSSHLRAERSFHAARAGPWCTPRSWDGQASGPRRFRPGGSVWSGRCLTNIDTARWDRTITSTLDEVVGLQFSYSYSSPAQLGDQKDAFERDMRRALTEFSPAGTFDELVRTEAIVATRP
ncbi:hypothetical protein ACFPH6_20535 [Streptomyces xiangluensis]|uniref:Uncharacterized protein n=1 Tax=Streptomyces xiangluensis TaxID=2665720 RepID=A0ABV8YRW3_9ACTN